MAKVKIQGNASGTGVLTVTAPNTSTDRTVTLPDATGTLINTAPSTSGNILTSDGTNWTSAAAGGKELQVVQTSLITQFSTSTVAYTDVTGYNVTITPALNTSKVLIFIDMQVHQVNDSGLGIELYRGSTKIFESADEYDVYSNWQNASASARNRVSWCYLDSPATSSATTYKIKVGLDQSKTLYVSRLGNPSLITAMEIGV